MSLISTATANLQVLPQLGLKARQRRRRDMPLDADAFRHGFENLLKRAPASLIAEHHFVELPARQPPWHGTALELKAGSSISTFACGRTWLSRALHVYLEPDFQLWLRISPDGEVFRGTRASHSFVADRAGQLQLASYLPGEWATLDGTLRTPEKDYRKVSGGMTVLLIRWAEGVDPAHGVEELLKLGDVQELVASEHARLSRKIETPDGWKHLWYLGPSEIYSRGEAEDHTPAICCHTRQDVAILQHEAEIPLRPDTRLQWSWKVDALPSQLREDTVPTHDYLSIAVEFDNGLDLTYMWSSRLPVGHHFGCPLPTWKGRETHWVVRSGNAELGRWLEESRPVHADYGIAIGGPVPEKIVRVWLISVSLFQRCEGRCSYANIRLSQGDNQLVIE